MTTLNRIPTAFIFQGRMHQDEWKSQLSPLKDTLFYVGEKDSPYVEGKPVALKSDAKGMLFPVDAQLQPESVPYHFIGQNDVEKHPKTFVRPPISAMSYLAVAAGEKWAEDFHAEMNQSTNKGYQSELKKIPLAALRQAESTDQDASYEKWLHQAKSQGLSHVYGYVLPKVRAAFFILTIKRNLVDEQ